MKTKLFLLSALLVLGSCADVCKENENGVTVKVQQPSEDGPKLVRLEVMGEKLIHVSATPDRKFADPESLVIIPAKEKTGFAVEQNGDTVVVSTSEIKANVLASTGEVWFTDMDGNVLLREEAGGGKSF